MRREFLAASVAAAATLFAAGAGKAATAFDTAVLSTPGLLGYFPFTAASQANDVSGAAHTGSLQNGASLSGSGPFAGASSLVLANGAGGTANALASGDNPLKGGIDQTGSLLVWFKLAQLPSLTGRAFSLVGESTFGDDLDLQINPDNKLSFFTDSGSATQVQLGASDVGQWEFVVATFTAGVARNIYINGVSVADSTPGGHSLSPGSLFYQGESPVFTGRYFDGSLADAAIFSTALSADQVAGLYAASQDSGAPEPASWALMLTGFFGLGATLRRQRRSVSSLPA